MNIVIKHVCVNIYTYDSLGGANGVDSILVFIKRELWPLLPPPGGTTASRPHFSDSYLENFLKTVGGFSLHICPLCYGGLSHKSLIKVVVNSLKFLESICQL